VGVLQGIIAVTCNMASKKLGEIKFDHVYDLLEYNTLTKHNAEGAGGRGAASGDDYSYYTADGYLDENQDGIPDNEQDASSAFGGEGANLSEYWFNFGNSPFPPSSCTSSPSALAPASRR